MIERITVIGAGATGHTVSAVMTMRGFEVTLYDDERFARHHTVLNVFHVDLVILHFFLEIRSYP